MPLFIVIHGAFSTGKQTETETGFSALADEERFLVDYPEGIGLFQHWNASHCCGKAADDQVDNVGFVAEFWRTANGCEPEPVKESYDNGAMQRLIWNGCRGGSSVEFYLSSGRGRQWPAPWFTGRLNPDHPLKGFDTTKRIWEFFSRFRRSAS